MILRGFLQHFPFWTARLGHFWSNRDTIMKSLSPDFEGGMMTFLKDPQVQSWKTLEHAPNTFFFAATDWGITKKSIIN